MHQHPRPSSSRAQPTTSDGSNLSRANSSRDREPSHLRSISNQGSGSSEDFVSAQQEVAVDNTNPQPQRLNQVIQNFHTKAALIILQSRVDLAEAFSQKSNEKRINRWFNIDVDETEEYSDDIRRWRKCNTTTDRPPPLVIEIFLTADIPTPSHRLVILDDDEKRWDVRSALESDKRRTRGSYFAQNQEVLLERWTIELGQTSSAIPPNVASILPTVYKEGIVLFRALYSLTLLIPAWKLSHQVRSGRSRMALKLGYRILDGSRMENVSRPDNLRTPLYDSSTDVTESVRLGETKSPAGPFSIKVEHRRNCDFRIDDSEELLSSRFLGTDDQLFHPTVRPEPAAEIDKTNSKVGSLPNDRRQHLLERPELGHAYGSMSTFHQAGFGTGTSPLSALRSARDLGQASPSPEQNRHAHPIQPQAERAPIRATPAGARRSSFSFQPFKAPALSASPLGSSPRTNLTRVSALGSLTEESYLPPPNAQAIAARRTPSHASDNAPSSISSSPRPAPNRYTSSFSHRRARLSSGGTTSRPDEDQISSGRGSAASSNVPPGSGLMAEASGGGSSGSMQEEDDNIGDFLGLLEVKKTLTSSGGATPSETARRRTINALDHFQKMKDVNTALTESITSSLMVARPTSASGRQPGSIPAMIGPTSISTSSSPGKPQSPHTPHTPFAPSRLSAAYSHDDHDDVRVAGQDQSTDNMTTSGNTAQPPANSNVPAIDIPSSPRPFSAAYRRSSSAQRKPASLEDDIGDIFGMRSASMGAQDVKPAPRLGARRAATDNVAPTDSTQDRSSLQPVVSRAESNTDSASDPGGVGRTSNLPYRSRFSRTTAANTTPPQGSTSSFGGTNAGSVERTGDSSASAGEGWTRSGRYATAQRPETKFPDDEDFFPFAMERSDFATTQTNKDGSSRGVEK